MKTLTKREKYTMDISDIAKDIRKQLKHKFPKCKFSVRIERFSMGQAIDIHLISAPFEAINKEETIRFMEYRGNTQYIDSVNWGNAQLNEYQFDDFDNHLGFPGLNNGTVLTWAAWQTMKTAKDIIDFYNFDESDTQTDYFHVNFYTHYQIGKWDKPFVVNA